MDKIAGELFRDERGLLIAFNQFDFRAVKRMYVIENLNTDIVRAWQAHKEEHKWFYVSSGSFLFVTVKIDDFEAPSRNLNYQERIILAEDNAILHIPGGLANGFKSLVPNSRLIVFSSSNLYDSKSDDYRYESSMWYDWTKDSTVFK